MAAIQITHFSDLLCVWAYVSQARVDELKSEFADKVEFQYRYFPVFGDTLGKFAQQWSDRGGIEGYARHVKEVAEQFGHVPMHPDVWVAHTPRSSLPAHLHLNAVQILESEGQAPENAAEDLAWRLRQAFFADNANIAETDVIRDLAGELGIDAAAIKHCIRSGAAHAGMAQDMQQARDLNVRSSPTFIFNEDRQRLTGNVGYRIIEANVRELLTEPSGQNQSWC
ncbi:MAG: DsbA family protein [Salinisphaeraceae bacterium]|nr:DsbA family protein [Salinisphaeraceae bacterium]